MIHGVGPSGGALPVDREVLREAIVDGAAERLSGLRECDWFDAKGAPYRLDQDDEKYELAKDVTAFANADGGILLLPVTTVFDANGELVDRVKDTELARLDADRVRKVIKEWVEPRVQGLEVLVIETAEDRGRLMIHVPPQPREVWPHIVTRGSFDGWLHNVGVSICVRAGADIATHGAPAVHALLAEGHRARTRGSATAGVAVVADPPSFEPAPAGTGSFNQHQASGTFNAHLTNHGGSAALVLGVELGSPFGAHDGQAWLAQERQGSPSNPPLRVPRGAHLQVRFEDPALQALGQAGGELELRVTYQPINDPGTTHELAIQLLRNGTTSGRPQWKAGRQRLIRVDVTQPTAPPGVDDVLDELATIQRRLAQAQTTGWYGYDFVLPAHEYHEHKDAIPRHLRAALRAVYVPADDLNRIVKGRDPDGSDVQPSDDLQGLLAAVHEGQRQLKQL